jgi:hypothetical protein
MASTTEKIRLREKKIMFDKFKKSVNESAALLRVQEEKFYEVVSAEIDRGERRPGLWAKALADCGGLESKAATLYLKYRVQSLKDELTLERRADEARRQAETASIKQPSNPREPAGPATGEIEDHLKLIEAIQDRGFTVIQGRSRYGGKWIIKEPSGTQVTYEKHEEFCLYAEKIIKKSTRKKG